MCVCVSVTVVAGVVRVATLDAVVVIFVTVFVFR